MPDASRIGTAHRQRFCYCTIFRATAVPNTFTAVSVGEPKKLLRRTYNFVGRNHADGTAGCRTGGSFDPADPVMSIDVLFRYAKPEHLRLKGGALHAQFRCGAVGSGNHPADLPQNLQDVVPLHSSRVPGIERFPSALRLHNSPTGTRRLVPSVRITERSRKFSSSRMFPGQCHRSSASIASTGIASIFFAIRRANFWTK